MTDGTAAAVASSAARGEREVVRSAALGLALVLVLALPALASAQPAITRPVTDEAGVLSSEAVSAIEARLHAHRDAGHAQIALLIVRTMHGVPITDYAMRAAEAWGGGAGARDDGVLFVLAVADRDMRIEVGYGLEQAIPDAAAMRILDTLVPPMRAGRFDAAAWLVSDALVERTGGASEPMPAAIAQRTATLPPETAQAAETPSDTPWPPADPIADAAYERELRERDARETRAWLGCGAFFVLPILFVFLYLWRSSNVEYDADGVQRVPWRRLFSDVALLAGAFVAALASGGGGGGGGGSPSRGGGHGHARHRSSGGGGSPRSFGGGGGSSRSYGGGGGGFGGGGASKRW